MRHANSDQAKQAIRQMIREAVRSRLGMLAEQEQMSYDDAPFEIGVTPLDDTEVTRDRDATSVSSDAGQESKGVLGTYSVREVAGDDYPIKLFLTPDRDFNKVNVEMQSVSDKSVMFKTSLAVKKGQDVEIIVHRIKNPDSIVDVVWDDDDYSATGRFDVVVWETPTQIKVLPKQKKSGSGQAEVDQSTATSSPDFVEVEQSLDEISLAHGTYLTTSSSDDPSKITLVMIPDHSYTDLHYIIGDIVSGPFRVTAGVPRGITTFDVSDGDLSVSVYTRTTYNNHRYHDRLQVESSDGTFMQDTSGTLQDVEESGGNERVVLNPAEIDAAKAAVASDYSSSGVAAGAEEKIELAMGVYRRKDVTGDTVFTLTPIADFKIVIEVAGPENQLVRKDSVDCKEGQETEIFRTSQFAPGEQADRIFVSDDDVFKATNVYDRVFVNETFSSGSSAENAQDGRSLTFSEAQESVNNHLASVAKSGERSAAKGTGTTSGARSGTSAEVERDPVQQPQVAAASSSLQKKIYDVAKAIQADFGDVEPVSDKITLVKVASANPEPGHTWIDNSAASRGKFGLSEWSSSYGDKYTYYALVNDTTMKPVAFVVASDPQKNNHYSTGRFIGPGSKRENLRTSFCKLYKRATGEDYGDCPPVSTGGSAGSSTGTGGTGSGSSTGVVSSSSGQGAAERAVTAANTGVGGAINVVKSGGFARSGRGDASSPGILGIGQPAQEKLRRGRVIITKSENTDGFPDFPEGPNGTFMRKSISSSSKLPPSSLMVRFKHNVESPSPTGYAEYLNFGPNRSIEDIEIIKLGWGARYVRGGAFGLTLRPGSPEFVEAAQWILDHQAEFDLITDQTRIVDARTVTVGSGGGGGSGGSSTSSPTTSGQGVSQSIRVGGAAGVSEGARRSRSLLDLYRF